MTARWARWRIADVTGNARSGVGIRTGADPTLRRNRIQSEHEQNGVLVYESGLGTLKEGHRRYRRQRPRGVGDQYGRQSDPARQPDPHNNKQNGVMVYDGGLGMLEDDQHHRQQIRGRRDQGRR